MAAHTPGPWLNHGQYNALRDEIGAEGRAICTVWTRKPGDGLIDRQEPQPWPEGEANARLIAAAPDMLAALVIAREFISVDRNSLHDTSVRPDGTLDEDDAAALGDYDAALRTIDAALAKASCA